MIRIIIEYNDIACFQQNQVHKLLFEIHLGIQLTGLINNVNFPHKLHNLPTLKLASMNDKITIINDEFA
jgi:hypothetical protein